MIASVTRRLVRRADATLARLYLAVRKERPALLCFLFHSLFRNEQEMGLNLIDPLERTTVPQFRTLIEYYLRHGYRFISPADLENGLDASGKYTMITFDDGYYNNRHALPILEELKVPATFFISTDHIQQNKCFWWDALYRERTAQGATYAQLRREGQAMKALRTDEIETKLKELFGPDALRPRGDVDRPFTPAELREFSQSPYVNLGNHTANHAILTNYTPDQVRDQVRNAQESLRDLTGVIPTAIAYPNGAHDEGVLEQCAGLGLQLGFTVRPQKIHLPLPSGSAPMLQLGRFCPHSDETMEMQCRTFRSDLMLYGTFRDLYLRLVRGQVAQ